ncbi:MAG: YihY/virulence factor BrkB family protein [Myxococcales bacterium]|nr:YihY/virulence factor BrkB family protein [Myxococcales bacterium]
MGLLGNTALGRFASDTYRALRGLVHGFRGEAITLRAGSLTFHSLFALVPMLTVALAAVQLFHQAAFQKQLTRFVQDMLAPGVQSESAAFLQRFITAASSRAAGGLSFVFVMISAALLLRNLDASLNEIWAVRRRRPLWMSGLLYALLLTLGPLVLGLWLGTTAGLRKLLLGADLPFSQQALRLGAAAVSVFALTAIYKLAPHAPVRVRSALAGGLLAGLGWELAKTSYASFAELAFRYNPLYGSLSAVPLFLAWVYVTWWLVLFGARLSYAVEHAEFRGEFLDLVYHPRARELIGAAIARHVTSALAAGRPAPTGREIARQIRVPAQMVLEVVHLLEKAGLLELRRGGLLPAKEPSTLSLADVSAAVGGVAKLLRPTSAVQKIAEFQELERVFGAVDDATVERLSKVSWSSLAALGRSAARPQRAGG